MRCTLRPALPSRTTMQVLPAARSSTEILADGCSTFLRSTPSTVQIETAVTEELLVRCKRASLPILVGYTPGASFSQGISWLPVYTPSSYATSISYLSLSFPSLSKYSRVFTRAISCPLRFTINSFTTGKGASDLFVAKTLRLSSDEDFLLLDQKNNN